MSEQPNLRDALISAFEQLKSQYGTISSLMADIAALRTTVLESDVRMQVRYSELFAENVKEMTPTIVSATKLFDDLIAALKAERHWLN